MVVRVHSGALGKPRDKAFIRFIWKIEPLATMNDEAIVITTEPAIESYVDGDIRPPAPTRSG